MRYSLLIPKNTKRQTNILQLKFEKAKNEMEEYINIGSDWFLSKAIKKELLRDKINELIKLKSKK